MPRSTIHLALGTRPNSVTNSSSGSPLFSMNRRKKLDTTTQHGVQLSPNTPSSKRSISPSLATIFATHAQGRGLTEETPAGASLSHRRRTRTVRRDGRKKVGRRDEDATVVTIDQTRKAVGADLYVAWSPEGERPTVGVTLLRAVTEKRKTTVLECGGSHLTGERSAFWSISKRRSARSWSCCWIRRRTSPPRR